VFASVPSYDPSGPPPSPLRNGVGTVTFSLGLIVVFGLVVYAAWSVVDGLTAATSAIGSAVMPATHGAAKNVATAPPVAARLGPATPSGTTMAFDQLWTAGDGNTIVAGTPTVSTSAHAGESVIRVPVTLTNNGAQDWNPMSTTFVGTLNHAPVPESTEGDWSYSTPIVPRTSVTLTKVFVTGPGQFTLTMSTPHGVALFSGHV
jgi:hypothetical protein